MNQRKILIPTDVPFWHRRDGAAQRIFELVRFLRECGGLVRVFYLFPLQDCDKEVIEACGLDVVQASSDVPPQSLLPKLRWYFDATINQIRGPKPSSKRDVDPMGLDDFRWPWAIQQFRECVRSFDPDCILVEYVKLTYLLEALTPAERSRITCLVDTHDVLHLRCEQFKQHGYEHWIQISRDEEAECLAKFDVAIAIQPDEAELFQAMAPNIQTIVARHSVERMNPDGHVAVTGLSEHEISIGYLGSRNFTNTSAVANFLKNVWPKVLAANGRLQLKIGGSVCDWLKDNLDDEQLVNVQLLGFVEQLKDFYSQVDFVINPVEFGTGLKIKNCESLAFGKPLVTTQQGWVGDKLADNQAVLASSTPEQFGANILLMAEDLSAFQSRCEQAVQLARSEFSDEKSYSALRSVVFAL